MRVLISAIGITPEVVTETIDKLKEQGVEIDKVILLKTEDLRVDISVKLLKLDFKKITYKGNIALETIELPFEDISSQKDHEKFYNLCIETIKREVEEGNEVVISVAGGRKTMGVALYKAGMELGISKFYHVIASGKVASSDSVAKAILSGFPPEIEKALSSGKVTKELRRWIEEKLHPDLQEITLIEI